MTSDLLAELYRRGVRLRLTDGQLHVTAPPGALTPQLREEMKVRRDELAEAVAQSEGAPGWTTIQPQPERRYDPFPLTDIQLAYWVGRSAAVELGGNSTHGYIEIETTQLDVPRLNRSLDKVIARHDMLRAIVAPDGRQRVLPEVPAYDIAVADLSGLDREAREAGIARIRDELGHQVLPTDRWPLFEVRASRLDDQRWRLHLSIDMLIMDGFSIGIFQRDLHRFYTQPELAPEPIEISFRDCVLAEEQRRGERQHAVDRQYWLDRLDQLPPGPDLPLAVAPRELRRPRFTGRQTRLPRDQWSAIKEAGRRHGFTPSAVLISAFADVLRRWSKRPEFTVNLTLFNRPPLHPRIADVIGDFTSVILLAVRAGPDDSFAVRTKRLHQQLLDDLAHSSFSGIRVLRERARRLRGRPGAAMPVVFTSMIGFESSDNLNETARRFGDVVYHLSQTPQVWLDYQVMEDRGDLVINWDFVDQLFPDAMVDEMFSAHRSGLERLSGGDDAWNQ